MLNARADDTRPDRVPVAIFRPRPGYRFVLLLQWPVLYGTILLVLLLVLSFGHLALSAVIAIVLIWGSWRALNVRLTIRQDSIEIANQVRSYKIEMRHGHVFQSGIISSLTPSAPGVHLAWMGGSLPIVVTATLSRTDRLRLAEELQALAERTGCASKVPHDW